MQPERNVLSRKRRRGTLIGNLSKKGKIPRVKTQLTMLRFNGLVNRIGGPTDAGELVLV